MLSRQLQHKNKLEPLDYPMYTLSTHETGYYLERLTVLWQAKRMIINTVLIFFLAALFISFLLPQRWTSQAIVTPADAIQWRVLEEKLVQLRALDVEVELKPEDVFALFIKKFSSRTLLESYLQTSPGIMMQLKSADIEPVELQRAITVLSDRMKAVNNDENRKNDKPLFVSWTLSFTAPDAKEAQDILAGYIQFITQLVVTDTVDYIRLKHEMTTRFEEQKLLQEENKIKNLREANIKRLSYSLEIANATGIKKPLYSNGQAVKDDPDYAISLGADGLTKKLQIEKSMTDPAQLYPTLRAQQFRVKQLTELNIGNVKFRPFHFQQSPSLPSKKDGVGTAMVLILAAMLGGGLACGGALLRHAFVSRQSSPE
ncbi:LPS O-antigen length regulator [Escherichia coli]|uniref:LPS O-antigen length regulator Wzz(fepE) n=1 Tax=Escherichia coli TaxID=562 RepID=UPI000BAF75CC|nr:LPS O-antigen length regulator Wzz(fepE) [Escherichia coli]EAC1403630.1 LPS O-antigen length regulator [Escherichia coli]EFN9260354.1 LPS O-antigen length regulator [Escherichia coli]EJJ0329266.1 LPS O-antigen length regulator [Escherichia coli]MXF12924.1 LPS O-antigen length regulator [Escherichia coli]PAZ23852.1 LPS O-antigen length regulator [Escherichia coli]